MTNQALIQGTPEWLDLRRSKIMASDAPVIMGVSPWKTPLQLFVEKIGGKEQEKNPYMQRGTDLESEARLCFEMLTGHFVNPKVLFHPCDDWMGASVDGINDEGILVEIKCPGKKDHELALKGEVPEKYYPQLQHQMYVCTLDSIYYFSYRPDHEEKHVIIKVAYDGAYMSRIFPKLQEFYECLVKWRSTFS